MSNDYPPVSEATPSRNATQRTIAERCGVSQMTVSRVLRGDPAISNKTTELVLTAVKEMGYDPVAHDAARRMVLVRSGRRVLNHLVAIAAPEDCVTSTFFAHLLRGVTRELTQEGYSLLFMSLPADQIVEPCNLPASFRRGDVDGILVFNQEHFLRSVTQLPISTPPVVSLMASCTEERPVVCTDDESGGYQATRHLLELGHRHVLFISNAGSMLRAGIDRRRDGMVRALREFDLTEKDHLHEVRQEKCRAALSAQDDGVDYLRAHPEITAILGEDDAAALDIWHRLIRAGYAIPHDYSIVGFNDTDARTDDRGENLLTTVRRPFEEVGREATRLLLQAISAGNASRQQCMLPTTFVQRCSTAPPAR